MKYSVFVLFGLALSACTTVPGAANDASRIGASAVYSAATIAGEAVDGAANALTNVGNDIRNTARAVTGQ
jgi:predicted small secreted protein